MNILGGSNNENDSQIDDTEEQDNNIEELERKLDEISKRIDDIETSDQQRESELKEIKDRIDQQDKKVDGMESKVSNIMDMYDDFAAGVNPLTKTKERRSMNEQEDNIKHNDSGNSVDNSRNDRDSGDDNVEETVDNKMSLDMQMKDDVYPVNEIKDDRVISYLLRIDKEQRGKVIEKLVKYNFIISEATYDLDIEIENGEEDVREPSYKYYEELITRLAQQ